MPIGDLKAKFEAFGWLVVEIRKGNDVEAVFDGLKEAKKHTGNGKPVCVFLNTIMGTAWIL